MEVQEHEGLDTILNKSLDTRFKDFITYYHTVHETEQKEAGDKLYNELLDKDKSKSK